MNPSTVAPSGLAQDGDTSKLVSQTQVDSESGGVVAAGRKEDVLALNDKGEKWKDILHSDKDGKQLEK